MLSRPFTLCVTFVLISTVTKSCSKLSLVANVSGNKYSYFRYKFSKQTILRRRFSFISPFSDSRAFHAIKSPLCHWNHQWETKRKLRKRFKVIRTFGKQNNKTASSSRICLVDKIFEQLSGFSINDKHPFAFLLIKDINFEWELKAGWQKSLGF